MRVKPEAEVAQHRQHAPVLGQHVAEEALHAVGTRLANQVSDQATAQAAALPIVSHGQGKFGAVAALRLAHEAGVGNDG